MNWERKHWERKLLQRIAALEARVAELELQALPSPMDNRASEPRGFRDDSAARMIAERLLDRQPHTRIELAQHAGVRRTSVNRVVGDLRASGYTVEEWISNRERVYQVLEDS